MLFINCYFGVCAAKKLNDMWSTGEVTQKLEKQVEWKTNALWKLVGCRTEKYADCLAEAERQVYGGDAAGAAP